MHLDNRKFVHFDLTSEILDCCFDIMNEIGAGFLESVYKNALVIALKEKGMLIEIEPSYEIYFRNKKIGLYKADIVVEKKIILELKCCKSLLPEHKAQLINYLAVSNIPVGLLINFQNKNIEYKRLYHPTMV